LTGVQETPNISTKIDAAQQPGEGNE
jgi:hypothetical protein